MVISGADTERGQLVDMAADHAANYWYKLKYPELYRSVRYVQGHAVLVEIREAPEGAKQAPGRDAESPQWSEASEYD